ncbi:MAG TPA: sensor histidine kinase [Chloroflexota bacterium]|nr:sensor histidine kinase [Chloroflexota bacterium]
MSQRAGVLRVVALSALPLVLLAGGWLWTAAAADRERVIESRLALARAAALVVESFLNDNLTTAQAVALAPGLADPANADAAARYLKRLADANPAWDGAGFVDADGWNLVTHSTPPHSVYVGDRPYFQEAVATGRPVVSNGIVGRVRGSAGVVLAAPVDLPTGGRGIFVVALPTARLGQSLQAQIGSGQIQVVVVDAASQALVSDAPAPLTSLASLRGRPEIDAVLAGAAGSQVVQIAGAETLVAYAPVAAHGWGVLVAEPTASAFAWVRRNLVERLALLGVIVLLVGWIGWYLGGRLARYYRETVAARTLAEEAVRTRDEFLASAAHDLRNPLTAIRGAAQLLQRQAARGAVPPEQLARLARHIETSTSQMAALVDELLDLARLQVGRSLELERHSTDLVALVARVVADCQETTTAHELRFESAVPRLEGLWDGARLERVVGNLLANAIKYSPAGGVVVVQTREVAAADARWAELQVQDHGMGIPRDELPRIFDRFYRGSRVVGQIRGSGIGLAAVRQIVEQHGGTVVVESAEGAGAVFTVCLPLDGPAAPAS